jgi:hypothetical protein
MGKSRKGGGAMIHQQTIKETVKLMKKLIPLVKLIVSDEFTADERRQLRILLDYDGVFKLSNLINRLCSEKALELYKEEEKRKNELHYQREQGLRKPPAL